MDLPLKAYLQKIGLRADDLQWMIRACPGLHVVTAEKALSCIELLIANGYPESDLNWLLVCNPGLMLYYPKDLELKIRSFSGQNLGSLLKLDPYIL